MPKPPFWNLPTPDAEEETRTFTDPSRPEYPVTITLRRVTHIERAAIRARSAELEAEWCDQRDESGRVTEEADLFPLPDGTAVKLNPDFCYSAAMAEGMQAGPEEDRYSFIELIGLSLKLPAAYQQMSEWAAAKLRGALGNSPKATTGTPSAPPII